MAAKTKSKKAFWRIGTAYFIRTVTHFLVGKLIAIDQYELVLADAAWIADTGRYANAIKSGEFNEIEPYANDVAVGRGSIIDATKYPFKLPLVQK
jgi:hypothetical protein